MSFHSNIFHATVFCEINFGPWLMNLWINHVAFLQHLFFSATSMQGVSHLGQDPGRADTSMVYAGKCGCDWWVPNSWFFVRLHITQDCMLPFVWSVWTMIPNCAGRIQAIIHPVFACFFQSKCGTCPGLEQMAGDAVAQVHP